jgi:hypothetical protein
MECAYKEKEASVYSNVRENIELVIYSLIAFFVPFLIAGPQWFVGTIVNAALVMAALRIKDFKVLPVIMLPSLAVLSRGFVFGPLTVFLAYLVPFIWAGNALFVILAKKLVKKSIFTFILAGPLAKASLLFFSAFMLVSFGLIPAVFIAAMGIVQLATALSGTLLALLLLRIPVFDQY